MPRWPRREILIHVLSFLSVFAFRIALNQPTLTPDGKLYMRIADNVILNSCYSASPPALALCEPTWANQPPGYPLFIAFVKILFGTTPFHVVVAQSFIYAVAVLYVLFSARQIFKNSKIWFIVTTLLIGFSPLTLYWSQWILTETLAGAATLWVAAECLRSLSIRKLRTPALALALTAALMVRWDLVWLALPVIVVAWHLHGIKSMIAKLTVLFGVMALPVILLILRALSVGLPAIPSALNASPEELPPGIVKFWRVTSIKQTATVTLLWNVWNRRYGSIESTFDYNSISSRVDSEKLRSTLHALSSLPDRSAVPPEIDESFEALALDVESRTRGFHRLLIFFERAFHMWTDRDGIFYSGWFKDKEYYFRFYRVCLLLLTFLAPLLFLRGTPQQIFSIGVGLFVVFRTLFLVVMAALEIRYTTPSIPMMELIVCLLIMRISQFRFNKTGVLPA